MVSFPQVSPPEPCAHLSPSPYAPHVSNVTMIIIELERMWKEAVVARLELPRGAGKSLARPTSRCILFDGENISFDANFVIYIYIYIYT